MLTLHPCATLIVLEAIEFLGCTTGPNSCTNSATLSCAGPLLLQLLEAEKARVRKEFERREGQIEVKKKVRRPGLGRGGQAGPGRAGRPEEVKRRCVCVGGGHIYVGRVDVAGPGGARQGRCHWQARHCALG